MLIFSLPNENWESSFLRRKRSTYCKCTATDLLHILNIQQLTTGGWKPHPMNIYDRIIPDQGAETEKWCSACVSGSHIFPDPSWAPHNLVTWASQVWENPPCLHHWCILMVYQCIYWYNYIYIYWCILIYIDLYCCKALFLDSWRVIYCQPARSAPLSAGRRTRTLVTGSSGLKSWVGRLTRMETFFFVGWLGSI